MILKSYVQLQLCGFKALDVPAGDASTCSLRASLIQTHMLFENYTMTSFNHCLGLSQLLNLYYNSGTTEVFQGLFI